MKAGLVGRGTTPVGSPFSFHDGDTENSCLRGSNRVLCRHLGWSATMLAAGKPAQGMTTNTATGPRRNGNRRGFVLPVRLRRATVKPIKFLGHITTAAHSARGAIYCVADSAISLCRCICWCPTFVLQIATTRNAVFPYARRGPDTKQTSDAIQAKISSSVVQLGRIAVNSGGAAQVAPTKVRPRSGT